MEDIIAQLKAVRIPIASEHNSDGTWSTWPVDAPGLWGKGTTIEDSIDDMIDLWREGLEFMARDHMQPIPEDMPLYMKVLVSTDEELRSCLSGEICAAS